MPLGQCRKNGVLVIDEAAFGENQHRQALMGFAEQVDQFLPRPGPGNSLHFEPTGQFRKRGQNALHERTVPAIEDVAGVGGVFETWLEKE